MGKLEQLSNSIAAIPSEASSLWHEAYDQHPAETVAATAAVGLTGAALLAHGGITAARMYANRPCDVLLFERTKFMGQALKEGLEGNGHRVTWLTGIRDLDGLVGEGTAGEAIKIVPRKFDFALVAGGLNGEKSGMEVARALRANGLPSLGMSMGKDMTGEFSAPGGSNLVAMKPAVYQGLFDKTLNLRGAIRSPQMVQTQLDELLARMKADPSLREASGERLQTLMEQVGT